MADWQPRAALPHAMAEFVLTSLQLLVGQVCVMSDMSRSTSLVHEGSPQPQTESYTPLKYLLILSCIKASVSPFLMPDAQSAAA